MSTGNQLFRKEYKYSEKRNPTRRVGDSQNKHHVDNLPGCENLFVLQLLHPGGGSHRHGDYDVVDVKGAFTSSPLDGLLLEDKHSMRSQYQAPIIKLNLF